MRKKKIQEDEIPKSVLKMKQDKEKREEAERNKKAIPDAGKKRGRKSKEQINYERKEKRRRFKRKLILFIILTLLIALGITLGVSA